MGDIRIRVELNKGGVGISAEKLAAVAKKANEFLVTFTKDLGLSAAPSEWVALNFKNESVDWDYRLTLPNQEEATKGKRAFRAIASSKREDIRAFGIPPRVLKKYASIADGIDQDEVVRFGLYQNGESDPDDWYSLSKHSAGKVLVQAERPVSYFGEIHGIIIEFFKEAKRPHFVVKDISFGSHIPCYFGDAQYERVVEVLEDRAAVVYVEGMIVEDVATGIVRSIEAANFRVAPHFDETRYRAALGSLPNFTGEKSTSEYIDEMRGYGEADQ